jgi:serine/threonine protein kinase
MCDTVANTDENREEIAQCKNQTGTSLLIMKNGGINLFDYGKTKKPIPDTFWWELQRIIRGIKLFLDNGYLHYDIKPDNMVYDEQINRVNFIDFGLMRKKSDIFVKGVYDGHYVSYHPTYSLEHFFYNKTNYDKVLLGSEDDKNRFIANFMRLVEAAEPLPIESPLQTIQHSLNILFKWVGRDDFKERILRDYTEFIMLERQSDSFLQFIVAATNKFDIYGFGLTIIFLLNRGGEEAGAFRDEMYELAYNMINPNIYRRYNIDEIEQHYSDIMTRHKPPFKVRTGGGANNLTRRKNDFLDNLSPQLLKFHSKISKKRSDKWYPNKNKKRVHRAQRKLDI